MGRWMDLLEGFLGGMAGRVRSAATYMGQGLDRMRVPDPVPDLIN